MAKKTVNVIYKVDDSELLRLKKELGLSETQAKKLSDELKKTNDAAKKVGTDGTNSFLSFKNVISSISVAALVYSLGTVAKKIFELGVAQEQTNIAFNTFLGSAEKAKRVLADLAKFAIVTPFTPDQVNKAAKTLLAFGVQAEELIPTLKQLGDVSSGTGKDLSEMAVIFGQIRSTGRLMGQDLLQLINAGFNPLQIISQKTGRSVGDLKKEMEKGLITFDMVNQAFKDATSEGGLFFNLMEKQSTTVGGLLSTIEGNVEEIGKKMFEANSGGLASLIGGVGELTSNVNALADATNKYINIVGFIPINVIEFFAYLAESSKEASKETAKLRNEQLKLRLDLLKADLEILKVHGQTGNLTGLQTQAELYKEILRVSLELGEKMPTTEDPLPWANKDKEKVSVGLVEAIEKKIKDLTAEIKKTTKTGDLGKNGLLVTQLRETQEELDKLLGKDTQADKDREARLKKYFDDLEAEMKAEADLRERTKKRKEQLERDSAKNSADLATYFYNLRQEKLREAEEEEIRIMEDAAARKRRIQEDTFALAEELAGSLVNLVTTNREEDIEGLQAYYDDQIKLAGDNDRAKKELEIKRERDLEAARQRQKAAEKESAKKRILIDGLVAIGKIFGEFGWPAGIIPAALMAGITAVNVAEVQKLRDGGWVKGPGGERDDRVPIMASPGEFMVNAAAARKSPKLLDAINNKKLTDKVLQNVARDGGSFSDAGIRSELKNVIKELQNNRPDDLVEKHGRLWRATKRSRDHVQYVRAKVMGDYDR